MRRTVPVLGMLLGVLVMVTSPAQAAPQEGGSMAALAGGGPPPPQYVLAADGTLTIGGDIVVNCNEWSAFYERYSGTRPSDPMARSDLEGAPGVLKECERAGFSPSGGTGAGTGSGGPSGVEDAEGTPVGGITKGGFVRTQYDAFVACGSGFPAVEQYAEACGKPGVTPVGQELDRRQEKLPDTGGGTVLPPLGVLLVAFGALVAGRRQRTSRTP